MNRLTPCLRRFAMATLDDLNKTVADLRDVIASNKNADGSRDKVLDENALVTTFTKALN